MNNPNELPAGLELLVSGGEPHLDDDRIYRIGELAEEFGVTLRTLRFYEDKNLVSPQRSGSTRLYSEHDRNRLQLILLAKRVGFSLAEIEQILAVQASGLSSQSPSKEAISKLLTKFKAQVFVLEAQRDELEQALADLKKTIDYLEA